MTARSDSPDPADEVAALHERVARLERRVVRERTAREEAERIAEAGMRDLWSANRLLEERVAERTAELEATLAATMVAAEAKERFLGELGHDLNTPLHNVLGLLELIEPGRLDEADRLRVDEVRRHAAELADLLHGLIELAGATGAPGPNDITTADAGQWLDDLVRSWTIPAAKRGQLLLPHAEHSIGEVPLDWRRLRRAADEVMENVTIHATSGPVHVSLSGGDEMVTLSIVDSGPGIDPRLVDSVTKPFVTGDDSHGLGVGLAIADRLVGSADGVLRVAIDVDHTTVELTLPMLRPS